MTKRLRIAATLLMLLLLATGGVGRAAPLRSAEVVDGWVVPCDGQIHGSAPARWPTTIYVRRSYSHVEAPPGTGYNLWLLVRESNTFFGAINEWVPSSADRMEWRTSRETYAPDWIVLPAGAALVVQANCGWGPYINTLVGIWYSETVP